MITYEHLETRYGPAAAYHVLTEIEKAARIRPSEMTAIDSETRLAHAFRVQDSLMAWAA